MRPPCSYSSATYGSNSISRRIWGGFHRRVLSDADVVLTVHYTGLRRPCIVGLLRRDTRRGGWTICGLPRLLRVRDLVLPVPRPAKSSPAGAEHRPSRLQHAHVPACDRGECR